MEGVTTSFSIIGGVALLFGLALAAWRVGMLVTWKRRRAVVVGYSRTRASRNSSYVRLTVLLQNDDGANVEVVDRGPWSRYVEGEEITVLVAPDSDPPRVVAPEFLRFWMMSLIFIPFGAVFLYLALVYVPSLE